MNILALNTKSEFKKLSFILIVALAFFCCLSSGAQDIFDRYASSSINVVIGETKPLRVNNPRQVKIGNPAVLDVVGAGSQELLLSGKKEGETTLSITDAAGEHTYTVNVSAQDLEKVKERLDFLLEAAGFDTLTTKIGDKEHKVFILGSVPAAEKTTLDDTAAPLGDMVVNLVREEELSVNIDVEVLEIDKSDLDKLGLSWNKSVAFAEGSVSSETDDLLRHPLHFFKIMKDIKRTGTFSATLNFLKQRNKARTLSRPKLVCLSGKNAKLLIGGERPIITSSTTTPTGAGTTTTYEVEMKEYGILLDIDPVVRSNDLIQIKLTTEITEVDTGNQISLGSDVTTPGFTERSAQTELTVVDGETVFLAGLIKSKRTDNRDGIQGLASIPFIGALFRNKDLSQLETEVVITLTPAIVRNRLPAKDQAVASVKLDSSTPIGFSEEDNLRNQQGQRYAENDPVVSYSQLVQNIINSHIRYPMELSDKNIQGTVKLSLHMEASGKLVGVVVMRSSGYTVLDELAEYTVKKLSPFPAFPSGTNLSELWIDIPIVYKI